MVLKKVLVMSLTAAFMVAAFPGSTAEAVDPEFDAKIAEIQAIRDSFVADNPEFTNAIRSQMTLAPDAFALWDVKDRDEAAAHVRDQVVYQSPAAIYAEFIVDLYSMYQATGTFGVEDLRDLTNAQIGELVDAGFVPSHDAYKKFNLLAFYASLRDADNEQWLIDQPKTTERADERMRAMVDGVSPQMRADAAALLGDAMALAYEEILEQSGGVAGLGVGTTATLDGAPMPSGPAGAAGESGVDSTQTLEGMLVSEAQYALKNVESVIADVKLTTMFELTIAMEQLTSLSEVYQRLETYYYEKDYFYHYEYEQRTWRSWIYIVDHLESYDKITQETYIENTYKLLEYIYEYQDRINLQGLVSGVVALDYEKVLPSSAETMAGESVHWVESPPDDVNVLMSYAMPFTFDVIDELSLYYVEEVVNQVLEIAREEIHYLWEYHIRQYWFWDPLDDITLPFENAVLNNAVDYVVSVEDDLDIGKVLNVIPVNDMFKEASITVLAPGNEYPFLDGSAYLSPAPLGFMPSQLEPGSTANRASSAFHFGPTPNVMDARASPFRATDHAISAAEGVAGDTAAFANSAAAIGVEAYGNPAALYELIPDEVRVTIPHPDDVVVEAPHQVDSGVDAYQLVAWETDSMPGFIPHFTFAGVRAMPNAVDGQPIVVNVNARGLGAPVAHVVDLNGALVPDTAASLGFGDGVTVSSAKDAAPAASQPVVSWAEGMAFWAEETSAWITDRY